MTTPIALCISGHCIFSRVEKQREKGSSVEGRGAAAYLGGSEMSETLRVGRISLKSRQQISRSCRSRSLWKLMV